MTADIPLLHAGGVIGCDGLGEFMQPDWQVFFQSRAVLQFRQCQQFVEHILEATALLADICGKDCSILREQVLIQQFGGADKRG